MEEQSYDDDYLAHYGVLGMKWGVRKDIKDSKTLRSRSVRKEIKKTAKERVKASTLTGPGSRKTKTEINSRIENRNKELPGFKEQVNKQSKKIAAKKTSMKLGAIGVGFLVTQYPTETIKGMAYTADLIDKTINTGIVMASLHKQYKNNIIKQGYDFANAMGLNAPNVIDLPKSAYKITNIVKHTELGEDYLAHHGVLGMKWGVRRPDGPDGTVTGIAGKGVPTNDKKKKKTSYADKAFLETPGATKTSVTSKTGEVISIEKDRMGPLGVAVSKLTGKKPKDNISSMSIRNKDGKKIGSFQIWNDGPGVVRGEWLEIDKKNQGRGYSEAAISALIKGSKNNSSVKEIRLQVPSEAAAAKHIYNKVGFKKDKVVGHTDMYGDLEDWVYKL